MRLIVTRTRVTETVSGRRTSSLHTMVLSHAAHGNSALLLTSLGLVPVYQTQLKIRIVSLPQGKDEAGMVNAYLVMNL